MIDEATKKTVDFLAADGYQNLRVLADGSIAGTMELLTTRAIFMGLNEWSWEKRYCFRDRELALEELSKLKTIDDEPAGYIAKRGC